MYYKIKYGLDELPAGEEQVGSYVKKVYTPEQQTRLGVDKEGNKIRTPSPQQIRAQDNLESEQFMNRTSHTHGPRSKLFTSLQKNSMRETRSTSPAARTMTVTNKLRHEIEDEHDVDEEIDRFQRTFTSSPSSPTRVETRVVKIRPLRKIWIRVQKQKFIHKLSANYYAFYHYYMCFVPSVLFAVIAGIIGLLLRAEDMDDSTSDLSAVVGIFGITSAVLQCMSSQLGLDSKAKEHAAASESYVHSHTVFLRTHSSS